MKRTLFFPHVSKRITKFGLKKYPSREVKAVWHKILKANRQPPNITTEWRNDLKFVTPIFWVKEMTKDMEIFKEFGDDCLQTVKEMIESKTEIVAHYMMLSPELKRTAIAPVGHLPKIMWAFVGMMTLKETRAECYAFVSDTWLVKSKKEINCQPKDHPDRIDAALIEVVSCTNKKRVILVEHKDGKVLQVNDDELDGDKFTGNVWANRFSAIGKGTLYDLVEKMEKKGFT